MTSHDHDDECPCGKDEALGLIMDGYLRAACEGEEVFRAYVRENASISEEEMQANDDDNYLFHSRIIHGAELCVLVDDNGCSTAYLQEYKAGLPIEILRRDERITAGYLNAIENGPAYFTAFVAANGSGALSAHPTRYTHDLGDEGTLVIQIDEVGRSTASIEQAAVIATVH